MSCKRSFSTSRRQFLQTAATAAMGSGMPATIASLAAGGEAGPSKTRQVSLRAPQIFVDLHGMKISENVDHEFHAATKHPQNPVLSGEYEWERKMGGPCGSFIYDPQEKLFKVWYQGITGDNYGQPDAGGPYSLNYAVSQDGVHWEKPMLGIHEFSWKGRSTRQNNIVVPTIHHNGKDHWESVLQDTTASDPAARYKAIGWSSNDPGKEGWCQTAGHCGIWSMTSPDGLRWTHCAEPIFHYRPRPDTEDIGPIGDAQSLMIDTTAERYVAFLRGSGPTQGKRVFSTSTDFVNWSPLGISMELFGHGSLYNHTGFHYGDSYLGLLTHYFVDGDDVHQLVLRLLTSRDGLRFRLAQGDTRNAPPLVDTGPIGEWDRFMVMLTGGPPIQVGDQLYIYYRGFSETHNRSGTKPSDSYYAGGHGLATIRVDGFASVAAGFDGGHVTTDLLSFEKPPRGGESALTINGKADHHARIVVEVLDEQGQPVPGFGKDDCIPLIDDQVRHIVRWRDKSHLGELSERPIRLRFHLINARLFSYTVG